MMDPVEQRQVEVLGEAPESSGGSLNGEPENHKPLNYYSDSVYWIYVLLEKKGRISLLLTSQCQKYVILPS